MNVNVTDSMGETPLHWAVMRGTYKILEILTRLVKAGNGTVDLKSKVRYF
jgi:ankyrin repeat protein